MAIAVLLNAGAALINTVLYMNSGSSVALACAVFSGTLAVVLAFMGD